MKVMLDNGPLMRKTDGICIEGELKDSSWRMALPTEKRLANNTDKYYLSVKETERSTEVQDLSFFLIRLAATMALPATFEVRIYSKVFISALFLTSVLCELHIICEIISIQ